MPRRPTPPPVPLAVLLAALVALAAAGCGNLLEPRENPTQYYLLGGGWAAADAAAPAPVAAVPGVDAPGLSVGLRALTLAAYLEAPTMVVREGPHAIRFAEFHRWGEDLDRGINRTVAGYLAARPGIGHVDVMPWPRWAAHDYTIALRVLRFEGVAEEEPVDGAAVVTGGAHLLATWEIVAPGADVVVARGTTDVVVDAWDVGDYDALAALLDGALSRLAADVGDRLATLPAP